MTRRKKILVVLALLSSVVGVHHVSWASGLENLYKPLLKKGGFFYQGRLNFFRLEARGVTGTNFGAVVYDEFDMSPYYFSLDNALRYSPWEWGEIEVGYSQGFPNKFRLLTYSTQGALAAVQEYDFDFMQDFSFKARGRRGDFEWVIDVLEKRQVSAWNGFTYPVITSSFNDIKAHYEDMKAGVRYVSSSSDEIARSNLSRLTRALLQARQLNIEAELRYRNGMVRRNNELFYLGRYFLNFYHDLNAHFTPGITVRYGLCDDTELETGFFYTGPFSYTFQYREFRPAGTTLFINGRYRWDRNFFVPFALRRRLKRNVELAVRADQRFITQQLDYDRTTSGSLEAFDDRELSYHNVVPTLTLTYLYEADREVAEDRLGGLTKNLLRKNQFLFELSWKKDLSHVSKRSGSDTLNLIDPYNLFLYPMDYFVAGSEYAAFFSGNNSRFATNVSQQNFHLAQVSFVYGFTDRCNAGVRLGYHSGSSVQHFTLFDLKDRSYKFRPHYFFDSMLDWRLNDNTLFTLNVHYVPKYITFLDRSDDQRMHKSDARYVGISAGIKVLF